MNDQQDLRTLLAKRTAEARRLRTTLYIFIGAAVVVAFLAASQVFSHKTSDLIAATAAITPGTPPEDASGFSSSVLIDTSSSVESGNVQNDRYETKPLITSVHDLLIPRPANVAPEVWDSSVQEWAHLAVKRGEITEADYVALTHRTAKESSQIDDQSLGVIDERPAFYLRVPIALVAAVATLLGLLFVVFVASKLHEYVALVGLLFALAIGFDVCANLLSWTFVSAEVRERARESRERFEELSKLPIREYSDPSEEELMDLPSLRGFSTREKREIIDEARKLDAAIKHLEHRRGF